MVFIFFFKRKTAYEVRISDWSSDGALPIFTERRIEGQQIARRQAVLVTRRVVGNATQLQHVAALPLPAAAILLLCRAGIEQIELLVLAARIPVGADDREAVERLPGRLPFETGAPFLSAVIYRLPPFPTRAPPL